MQGKMIAKREEARTHRGSLKKNQDKKDGAERRMPRGEKIKKTKNKEEEEEEECVHCVFELSSLVANKMMLRQTEQAR